MITGVDETQENDVLFDIVLLDGHVMDSAPEKLLQMRKQQFLDAQDKLKCDGQLSRLPSVAIWEGSVCEYNHNLLPVIFNMTKEILN